MTLEKIDWKSVSKTASYKKLKEGIWARGFGTKHATADMRIAVAAIKLYAKQQVLTFYDALQLLESNRKQSAISYYSHLFQSLRKRRRYHKSGNLPTWYRARKGTVDYRKAKFRELLRQQRINSKRNKTKKPRWSSDRKRRATYYRYLENKSHGTLN